MVAVASAAVGLAATIATAGIAATGPSGFVLSSHALLVSALLYVCIGAVVVARRPDGLFGWLLLTVGLCGTLGPLSEQLSIAVFVHDRSLPGGLLAAWFAEWYWLPWNYGQLVFFPLLFPTGRFTSRRWRSIGAMAATVLVVSVFVGAFAQQLEVDPTLTGRDADAVTVVDNPVGFLPVSNLEAEGSPTMLLILGIPLGGLAAVSSLVGRFRRSRGVERQQITWVVYGVVVTVAGMAVGGVLDVLEVRALKVIGESVLLFVIPVTLGVALLSNRLWDIDRVVSRTVSYLAVTVVLAGVYVGGVLGVGSLAPGGSSDLVVAASTLAVAALFQPVRRRAQSVVDRRFDRARYDAQQEVAALADRLRRAVELERLIEELATTVDRVVSPSSTSLVMVRSGARP